MANQSSALDILVNRLKTTGSISASPKSTTPVLSESEEEERFRQWQAEAEAARAAAEARNQNVFERAWNTVTGGVKGWAGNQAGFFGNIAEGLSRLGDRLGGNTSDYAGWATDELSAGQIGMEDDPAKRAQQLAEALAMQETGNRWSTSGSQDIERAKAGLGFWGGLAVDTGANAVQMGLDSLTGAVTGMGGLSSLFTRAAGGAMQEAEGEGAGLGQRMLYGGTVGAIEAATEKLFGGLAKIYGRGTAEGMVESVVRRLTSSAAGQRALLVMADMGGEAIEELISNIANPAAKMIYNGKSLGESYRENFSVEDALYDALVGGIMGGFGAGTKVMDAAIQRQPSDYTTATQRMGYTNEAEAALREQWGTDRAGRSAATEYAELIGRGLTGELSSRDQARLNTKPTAVSVMEDIRNRNPQAYNRAAQETGFVRDNLQAMFRSAGIDASDAELDVLANGYISGTNSVSNYLRDVSNSFNYGSMGLTLEQARKSAEKAGSTLNPVQFEHAFKLGEAKSADTADTTTDEGRTKVRSYLSKLGNQADAAAEVYEPTQDVQKYAEAMGKAVQLFAANGGDLKTIWNDAKTGKTMSSISYLTEKQIDTAQKLGAEFRTEQAESASRREAAFAEKRAKLDTLLKKGGNAAEYVDSTLATQRYISQLKEDIRGTAEGLELARKSEPGIVNTAEYKAAAERLNGLRKDLQGATELQKRLKKGQERAIGKKPGRKKGKVVYADKAGTASGIEYQAVDRSKLSKTQQATTRIAEAIADATGLEIRIISVPTTKTKGVGGEYIPGAGGVMYLNIDMTVDGKNMAAGSLFHELTHWIQEYAPAKYEELKRFVLQESQKNPEKFEDIFSARNRTSGYKTLSVDQVTDEMVANACMRIFEDPEAVKRLAVQHKGLWETIRDFIVKFVDDVKAAFAEMDFSSDFNLMGESQLMVDALEEMRDRFVDAFSTATENYQAEQIVGKENTATEGGTQMMAWDGKGESFSKDKYYDRQIDQWDKKPAGARIKVGELHEGSALNRVGFPAEGMWFDVGKIKKNMDKHDDHLTKTILKQIPALINDPIAITEYKGPKGDILNTVNVFGLILPDGKTPIVVGVMMTKAANGSTIINKIRTIHARGNASINDSNILYLNENKKRTRKWFQVCGNSVPLNGSTFGLIRSISYTEENGNTENAPEAAEAGTKLQVWEGEEPKKTQYGFKLMSVDANGLPHAMFIDAAKPYELGKWYKADSPKMENMLHLEPGYAYEIDENDNADMSTRVPVDKVTRVSKTGKKSTSWKGLPGVTAINDATNANKRWIAVYRYADGTKSFHNVGINGSGSVYTYALRPGIHAVDIPSMAHIGAISEGFKKPDKRRPNQRWFLIEYPVDQDYNQEAYNNPEKDIQDHLPERGWYSFQTNSGAEKRQHWFITGGMKIVGAISEADARKYARDRNFEEDLPWKDGKSYSEDDSIDLEEYMRTTKAQPTPSKKEMERRILAEREGGTQLQAWEEAKDSTGQKLTKEQAEYFADSKIRDADGRLKVMYHGGAGTTTVFDRRKSKASNLYGRGFYFTSEKSHAATYGTVREFYLNIRHPLHPGTKEITQKQLRAFLKAVAEDEDYGLDNYGYGATVDSVLHGLRGKEDFGILQDVNATAIGDFVEAVELFNRVNGTDYDGIVEPTQTVAFESKQIKSTDNRAPTENADIRFQMFNEVEETDKLIAVHNKTMSGLRRMIERGGVPFPSIAIKKAGSGHNHYGPVSIVFGRSRIDPEVNRANRIYGGDAWTPTEPRTEYEADSNKAYKIAEQIRKTVGSKMFESLRMGGSLDSEEIERKLGSNEGNIFEALKGTAVLKYAYLKSIGKEPTVPMKEKRLDGFSKYTNEQLLSLFKAIGPERIRRADYSDQEFRQKVADILNEDFIKDFRKKNAAKGISKEDVEAFLKVYERKPVYSAGNVNVGAIQDALRTFEDDGRKLQKEPDSGSFTSELRDNKDLEADPGYRKWIENLYKGIIKNSGIRNDKDVFTPSGNRRSFSQLHVPATLDNIAKVMSKQNEKGVTSFAGSNLMGTGTKTYRTVEEARADRERLYDGDYIDEEEFEGPKKILNDRLHELVEAAVKITSRDYAWEQRDSAREILLEAVRDSKTKAAMDRKLRSEAQWINYDPALTEELWQLAEDTRNMKVPYFEAKLRRVVYPEEALAYIVEDTAEETDADLLQKMRDMGLTVLTYKAGDAADRLRVLNSVEGAQFQQFDEEDNMHPAMRARLNEQTRLEEDLVQYFAEMNQNSDYWMSEEDVRGNLDFNFYNADATAGDTYDAGLIIDALIGDVKGKSLYERQRAYLLAERTLSHLSTRAQQRYTGDGNDGSVIDGDFAKWYNERHPNLYYPGYQPGDLFEHKYNKGGKADNIQKERDYLHGLLESGNLMEPELSEARDLLDQLTNPQPGVAFYQQWDDTYDDTKEESTGRDLAYSRIQSENAILNDVLKELQQLTRKQENTIGKLQQRLKLTKTPEVREGDAKRLAGKYLRTWDSKADRTEITQSIKDLGDYVLQGEVNADEVTTRAREIATKIVSAAETTVSPENEALEQIRSAVNGQKVYLGSDMLGELDQSGGLQAVKNRLFGKRVYLSTEAGNDRISVDRLYEQLHADFGEYWFPEAGSDKGPANAGEEILHIAEVLDAAGGMTVNPFGPYMGEAVQSLANDIVSDTLSGIMRPVQTDADKWKSRRDGLNERIKELKKQGELQDKEAARLWQTVYDLSIALDKAESRYKTLQTEADYRVAQTRAEGEAKVAEVRARERERADKQIQGLKDYYKDMRERAQVRREESAGVTKYRKQVQQKAAALYEMLMKNDDKKHVPEVLKKPVAEFLESIDFTSKRQLAGGEETNADREFGARLRALERALSGQQDYIDGKGDVQQDLGGYVDISQENLQYLRDVIQMIDTALRENRDFTVNSMNAQQLKQLSNFLSNLNAAIRGLNTFMANARFESVREAADQDIESLKKLGKPGKYAGSAVDRFAAWENGTPYYIMKRFGEGGKSLFDGFAKGWEKMAFNAKEIIEFTESLYSDKEVNTWKNEIRDIELSDGSKIRMTTAQIMELSMLLNREQALKHIEKGGIRIGDITEKGRVIHDTTHYHLTMDDIVKITGMLDARQRKVAQALQSYMARKGSEWGNEVSMRRFGYEFYTEGEHYYPIKTDANDRPMADTDAQMNSMFRLLNLSASKSLNPKASNALVVGNIFDTFADHMADMAKLNGMGLPILDAIKWFNFKERINYDDGTYDTRTMQGAMEQAYGTQALKYFRTLMKDINGMTESGDRGVSLPGKLMSNYKIAAVGANLRVALLQPTSYVRALTVLKPQYLAGVVPSRAAYQEAMKYSGTAVWKSLGYYDTDISKSMRGQIQHDDTLRDKIANASMALAEKGDQLTWSRLWTACKRQAKGENANLRGQALMDRTAELFREVVYSSQVMDSTLTRSEIMRGKTNWTKAMSAFMAEPTLSYNILLDAASEYMNDVRREGKAGAWKRNSGKIGKAFTVYVCSAAFSAVVESIADAARDDDDEKYLDKWLEAFLGENSLIQGNLAQDLTILGKLPYIKNFISTLQGYDSSDMSVAAFSNLVNAVNIWVETYKLNKGTLDKATKVTYYGRMTEWGKIYKTLQALSQLSGVAAANMTRDVTAIWNLTVGSFNPDMKVRTYDSNAMSESKTAAYEETVKPTGIKKGQYKNILAQADEDGNGSVKQAEMDAYLKEAVASNALTKEQADAVWDAQGWKKSWSEYGKPASSGTKSSTTSTEPKKTEKTSSEPNGEISGWDDFKTVAPIYGNPKKEAAYNAKPASMSLKRYTEMLKAADTDNNGSLKQDELGYQLKAAVQGGEISFDEAAKVWASQGWSHDLVWWANKHQ